MGQSGTRPRHAQAHSASSPLPSPPTPFPHLSLVIARGVQVIGHAVNGRDLLTHVQPRLVAGSLLLRVQNNILQVRLNRLAVHIDNAAENLVVLPPAQLLQLPPSGLLRFAHAALALCQHGKGVDAALLLQPHELLAEVVQGRADVVRLHIGHGPRGRAALVRLQRLPLAVLLQLLLLLRLDGLLRLQQRVRAPQLGNEVAAALLALVHFVLDGSAANDALQQDNGPLSVLRAGRWLLYLWRAGALL